MSVGARGCKLPHPFQRLQAPCKAVELVVDKGCRLPCQKKQHKADPCRVTLTSVWVGSINAGCGGSASAGAVAANTACLPCHAALPCTRGCKLPRDELAIEIARGSFPKAAAANGFCKASRKLSIIASAASSVESAICLQSRHPTVNLMLCG